MKTLLLLLILGHLAEARQDYDLVQPPQEIYTDLRYSLIIEADHGVEIGPIKPHPKITWLDRSIERKDYTTLPMHTELGFVVRAPGLIEFPPIPVIIENKSFFLRLDDITAQRNPAPEDFGQLRIRWNDQAEMPTTVHLGEAIEIDFIGELPFSRQVRSQFLDVPVSRVENASWYLFSRQRGRNARPEDYFYNFGQNYTPRRFVTRRERTNGVDVITRQYRSRLICSDLGEVSGHLGMTMSVMARGEVGQLVSHERTYLVPFRLNVIPLPPLPNERVVNTGLVGDWSIEASVSPRTPAANEPLQIRIDLSGQGDPNLRREFDFSREGFASVESEMLDGAGTNYDVWLGRFTQKLIPSGNVPTFPALTLATFDTLNDQWKMHPVSAALTLEGQRDISRDRAPLAELGSPIVRPVLLNLPRAVFPVVALAPLLPFLFAFLKRRLDQRDPAHKARQQKLRALTHRFRSENGDPAEIDSDLLPLLRKHLELPPGASTKEIADALEKDHPDLASQLREHSKASFSSDRSPLNLKALATSLAKLSLLFLLILQVRGTTLEEANLAFTENRFSEALTAYEALIAENPGQPHLYQNLALTYLAVDDPSRARAACHTALLLSPLDSEARALMDDIRKRTGAPALPGTSLLALRPDQWFILAALAWVITFLLLGLRHFPHLKIPRWAALPAFALAAIFLITGIWRNTHAYAENQFMVVGNDLPREPSPGTPDWDFPTLKNGQIVQVAEFIPTHARIETDNSSFWLPRSQLKQVW